MKQLLLSAILSAALGCAAAVPLRWTVETSRVTPATFDAIHGETLALEAAFQSYGKPLEMPSDGCCILWQTNGMGSAWWQSPATVASNRVSATFAPAMDPGAPAVTGFLGATGENYRAAFTLRFRHGPGGNPSALPLPTPAIDFATVAILNPSNAPFAMKGASLGITSNEADRIARAATSNVVDKAYVEGLGIEAGITAQSATNIAESASVTNAGAVAEANSYADFNFLKKYDNGNLGGIDFYDAVDGPNMTSLYVADVNRRFSFRTHTNSTSKIASDLYPDGSRVATSNMVEGIMERSQDLFLGKNETADSANKSKEITSYFGSIIVGQKPSRIYFDNNRVPYVKYQSDFFETVVSKLLPDGSPFATSNMVNDIIAPATNATLVAANAYTDDHADNTNNPHGVTAAQVGALTQSDADALYAPTSTAATVASHTSQMSQMSQSVERKVDAPTATNIVDGILAASNYVTQAALAEATNAVEYLYGTNGNERVNAYGELQRVGMGGNYFENSVGKRYSYEGFDGAHYTWTNTPTERIIYRKSDGWKLYKKGSATGVMYGRGDAPGLDPTKVGVSLSPAFFYDVAGSYDGSVYGFHPTTDRNWPAPYDRFALASELASAGLDAKTVIGIVASASVTNAGAVAAAKAYADAAFYPDASGDALEASVSAIAAHLNAEDARFVVTNYDSAVHTPSAYVEIKQDGAWLRIWREMTRWTKFCGEAFDWDSWGDFQTWHTNVNAELSSKADRSWGVYDSETGAYSPDGYTQISSSNILLAANMSYKRVLSTANAVWVMQCNQGTAQLGGDTNGMFRITDGDGNTQFEIVKGDAREIGADADGITVTQSGGNNVLTIPYSVVAAAHPTLKICTDLAAQNWIAEGEAGCAGTVAWSGASGAYVATVTIPASTAAAFVRATYIGGSETIINNVAPTKLQYIYIGNQKYAVGYATVGGTGVMTLTPQ